MRGLLVVFLLFVALSGCGSSRAVPPTLQRYQSLAAGLRATTSVAGAVARDMQALSTHMHAANWGGTQEYAGHLKWDASRLAADCGSAAAFIRSIARHETSAVHRQYFKLVLDGLGHEWAEARYLSRLARLAWWDPNMTGPGHATQLSRLDIDARWEAWQSLRSTRAAQLWRSEHRRSFLYVPVKQVLRA